MNNVIVYYKSKYGTTKKYAEYIASELGCECKDAFLATDEEIEEHEIIIFGGGVYAGAIGGSNFLNNHEDVLSNKRLIIFAVGITEYDDYNTPYNLFTKNVPQSLLKDAFTFNLFGAIDYKGMKFMEKLLLRSFLGNLKNKASYLKTPTDEKLIASKGKNIDLSDMKLAFPVIHRAKNIDEIIEDDL